MDQPRPARHISQKMTFDDWVKYWVELHVYPDAYVERSIAGGYGLVMVMKHRHVPTLPQQFAVKTFRRDREIRLLDTDAPALFERELRIWLGLPPHRNILPALGIDVLKVDTLAHSLRLPLVRMPFCDATLAEIVANTGSESLQSRLSIMSQICNGLVWAYKHGVHGHGDLKPENILLCDLRTEFQLPVRAFPNTGAPWMARVSDFGMSNIWSDMGSYTRCWRPYLAPERYSDEFEPNKSDAFSLGVVLTELLTGNHPAGATTRKLNSTWKRRKEWEKWANGGDRNVDEIENQQLEDLVIRCLSPDPTKRPKVEDMRDEVIGFCEGRWGNGLKPWIDHLNKEANLGEASEVANSQSYREEQVAQLGKKALEASIGNLASTAADLHGSSDPEKYARWLTNSCTLANLLLRRGGDADRKASGELAERVLDSLLAVFHDNDIRRHFLTVWGTEGLAMPDVEPEEIMMDFALRGYRILIEACGDESEQVTKRREQLSFKRRFLSGWTDRPL